MRWLKKRSDFLKNKMWNLFSDNFSLFRFLRLSDKRQVPCCWWCFGCEGGGGATGGAGGGGFGEGRLDVLKELWLDPKHGGHLQKQQVQGEWRSFFGGKDFFYIWEEKNFLCFDSIWANSNLGAVPSRGEMILISGEFYFWFLCCNSQTATWEIFVNIFQCLQCLNVSMFIYSAMQCASCVQCFTMFILWPC